LRQKEIDVGSDIFIFSNSLVPPAIDFCTLPDKLVPLVLHESTSSCDVLQNNYLHLVVHQ